MSSGPEWDSKTYDQFGRFVSQHGDVILSWLEPQAGEHILDAGCGDGDLTIKIKELGADVVGIEQAPKMVIAARALGLDVREMDLLALDDKGCYDAIFSNAVLHWIADWPTLLQKFHQALKPDGRLVVECGGFGNIAAIRTAIMAVAQRRGVATKAACEMYLSCAHAQALLEAAGFQVERIELMPRQTLLENGMAGWLRVFREPFFEQFSIGDERDKVIDEVLALLEGALKTPDGVWYADYVRLRFLAGPKS